MRIHIMLAQVAGYSSPHSRDYVLIAYSFLHRIWQVMFVIHQSLPRFLELLTGPVSENPVMRLKKTVKISRDAKFEGPFIRGKIRLELDHLYEHVLSKTRTARINGSHIISVLDSFSCECCPQQRQSNVARQTLTHAYYAFASYIRREGHLYQVFLVLTKTRLI